MTSSLHATSRGCAATQQKGRILAIDYGRRRLGFAISDELGLTAQTLPVLERKNRRDDVRRLRELAREHDVRLLLVGSPVHLDASTSEMAEEAARFAERVGKELGLTVELRDERLTSWEAEELRKQSGAAERKNSAIDSKAAAILLREYLDEHQAQHKKPRPDKE
jgi:putative holliday junction resolvase